MRNTFEGEKDKQLIMDREEHLVKGKSRFVAESKEEDLADRVAMFHKMYNQKTIPAEVSTFVLQMKGPLTDTTKRHRKLLLLLSLIAILMMKTGLVPEEVTALGIRFSKTDQDTILLITSMCIAYFLVGFVISVTCDLLLWVHSMQASEYLIFPSMAKTFGPKSFSARSMALFRFSYEIMIPLVLGYYSLKLLWHTSFQAFAQFF